MFCWFLVMVKITIVGTGYVGLVTGACLAETGHEVICSDIMQEKIDMLNRGEMPIFEIGLEELVKKNVEAKRLTFTSNVDNAINKSQVIFSCVGTPMGEDFKADLKYVKEVAKTFAKNLKDTRNENISEQSTNSDNFKIFVNKSTVPVGTGNMVKNIILENSSEKFAVVSNPEFLREGAAVKDFLNPDRVVIGTDNNEAKKIMQEVYKPFARAQHPILFTDIKSAELIKYASNSMLATRISFMNEIANFCDKVGANVKEVAKGMGFDSRIGPRFLQAGIGYGGSCFPKDVVALIESGKEVDYNFNILNAVENVNFRQKTIIVDKLIEKLGSLEGKVFSIWGLAFKPRTDDIREAPSIYIIEKLLKLGAKIKVYDKVAEENFRKFYPNFDIEYFDDKYETLVNSDGLLVLTEWDEFRILDFEKMNIMNNKLLLDGRNIYQSLEIFDKEFDYIGIGRK